MTDLFTNKNLSSVFIKKLCLIGYILISTSIWANNNDSSIDQEKPQAEIYISDDISISGLDFISNAKIYEIKSKTNSNTKSSHVEKQIRKIAQITKDPVKKKAVVAPVKVNFKINRDTSLAFSSISYWSSYFVQPIPQQFIGNTQSTTFHIEARIKEEKLQPIQYINSWIIELLKGSFSVRPPPNAC